MAILLAFRLTVIRPLLIACFIWSSIAHSAPDLDKLLACNDIGRLYDSMKARSFVAVKKCRSPRNALERTIATRSGLDTSQLCFDQSVPAAFLEGFSCMWQEWKGGAALVCFRSANDNEIKQYLAQYGEKPAAAESQYLDQAAACKVSNGDSARAQLTTTPPLLSLVSRFQFGFILSLGNGRPSNSYIAHGFATTDPTISSDVPSALEYVYVIADAPKYSSKSQQKRVGNWVIHVDEESEFYDTLNQEFRKKHNPLRLDAQSYDIESHAPETTSQSAKLSLIERLQRAIAQGLEDEGFRAISDEDLKRATGMSTSKIIEKITNQMPFGTKALPLKLGPTLLMLVNERRPQCAKAGRGVMAAYLMSTQPVPQVKSDFGNVTLIIAGLQDCARTSTTSTRTYVRGLIEGASEQLLTTIERN